MNLPAVIDRTEIAELKNPETAAQLVLFMGLRDLQSPPPMKHEELEDGTLQVIESDIEYTNRVWGELSRLDRGKVVYLGLQRASNMKEGLNDGIQLVVWRAYDNGWWIATDDNGGDDKAFRVWVKNVIVPEGSSATEATQLASTILNLTWLRDNGYVNEDLDDIFSDRPTYNRWRRVASPLRQAIASMAYSNGDDAWEEASQQIEDIVRDVNDPDKTPDDLDAIRSNPRIPPVEFIIKDRDQIGRNLLQAAVTDAQLYHMRNKMKGFANFSLEGEQTDRGQLELTEYKGIISKDTGEIINWYRRLWNGSEWEHWYECDEPTPGGIPDGAELFDEAEGLTYFRQWEAA